MEEIKKIELDSDVFCSYIISNDDVIDCIKFKKLFSLLDVESRLRVLNELNGVLSINHYSIINQITLKSLKEDFDDILFLLNLTDVDLEEMLNLSEKISTLSSKEDIYNIIRPITKVYIFGIMLILVLNSEYDAYTNLVEANLLDDNYLYNQFYLDKIDYRNLSLLEIHSIEQSILSDPNIIDKNLFINAFRNRILYYDEIVLSQENMLEVYKEYTILRNVPNKIKLLF